MNPIRYTKIYVALPVLDELNYLPDTINAISKQFFTDFEVFVCVNQPDDWWNDENKLAVCENNRQTLSYLNSLNQFPVTIMDNTTKGNGWEKDKAGIGYARKTLMDAINNKASENDIILSIDADTVFAESYFQTVIDNFNRHTDALAVAVPYFHRLTPHEAINRAMLRYEIYMRYYSVNLWRIGSPYTFTALGSAIALPVWAYRQIGGITPKKSGEDFYFLQKLKKCGDVLFWNEEKVYPAARFSDRVFFGTGPAMIKGSKGDWESYPVYHYSLFDDIKTTYNLFSTLFIRDVETPLTEFLQKQFNTTDLWKPLRDNYKTEKHFIKACHDKIDGLRILQYLKATQKQINDSDEQNLVAFLYKFYSKDEINNIPVDLNNLSFQHSSIKDLDVIRHFLMNKEEEYQRLSIKY